MKEFCDIPINPSDSVDLLCECDRDRAAFAEAHPVSPTRRIDIRSEAFVAIYELARSIVEGAAWNKKARIVLEYDPQASKMPITVFMESAELPPPGDRESL